MNIFLINNIKAICLSLLTYWALDYNMNYIFWLTSLCYFVVSNIVAILISQQISKGDDAMKPITSKKELGKASIEYPASCKPQTLSGTSNPKKEKSWDNLEDNAQLTFSLKGLKVLLRGAVNEGKQKAIKQEIVFLEWLKDFLYREKIECFPIPLLDRIEKLKSKLRELVEEQTSGEIK